MLFLILIPGAGDELQGIKKGILEIVDCIILNKTEEENMVKANLAKGQLENAMVLQNNRKEIFTCSSVDGFHMEEVYQVMVAYFEKNKEFSEKASNNSLSYGVAGATPVSTPSSKQRFG